MNEPTKWEYEFLAVDPEERPDDPSVGKDRLDAQGKEGWEAIGLVQPKSSPGTRVVVLLKRPVKDEPGEPRVWPLT